MLYVCVCWLDPDTFFFSRQCDEQKVWSEDHSILQAKRQKVKRHWGKRQEIRRQCVGMFEEGGAHRTGKSFLERQITCGEDKFEIWKTLHDEKKDVGETVREFSSEMKFIVLGGLATNYDPVKPLTLFCSPLSSASPFLHLSAATKSSRMENKKQKRSISAC